MLCLKRRKPIFETEIRYAKKEVKVKMELKRILFDIGRFFVFPIIVVGIVLFMILFGDPINDDLGGDC